MSVAMVWGGGGQVLTQLLSAAALECPESGGSKALRWVSWEDASHWHWDDGGCGGRGHGCCCHGDDGSGGLRRLSGSGDAQVRCRDLQRTLV